MPDVGQRAMARAEATADFADLELRMRRLRTQSVAHRVRHAHFPGGKGDLKTMATEEGSE